MAHTYNVQFAGEVITGHEPAQVREKLGKLFGADDATLDKLFSGTPRLIKKGCDRATAEKYRAAMQRAGAVAILDPPLEPPAAAVEAPAADAAPATAAARIAALAAAPDATLYRPGEPNTPPASQPATANPPADDALQLRPPESAVLEEHERAPDERRDIDTSGLSVAEHGERLAPAAPAPPPAPDTGHLDMAEAGADIPNLPPERAPVNPNTDAIGLAPEGTDFSDCAAAAAPPPQLDLSGIDIAPEGEDLLEERYRDSAAPAAPRTDHLSLED